MISYLSSILLAIGSSAAILGKVSYIALLIQLVINIFVFKIGREKIFVLLSIVLFFLILHAFHFVFDTYVELDISIVNVIIQLLVVITIGINFRGLVIVRRSLLIQLIFCICISVYGITFSDYSMFVNASNTKGFSSFFIPTGIYSTPQALASVALVVFFLYRQKIIKLICLFTILFSMNRTITFIFLSSTFFRYYKAVLTGAILLVPFLLIYLDGLNSAVNLRTILSRLYLFEGATSKIELDSFRQIIFGTLNTIEFSLPMYGINKNYIESSLLFIFKYFGVLGLFLYIFYGFVISAISLKNKQYNMFLLFTLYFFIAQLMTHEFLVSSYYQIVYIFTVFILLKRSSSYE